MLKTKQQIDAKRDQLLKGKKKATAGGRKQNGLPRLSITKGGAIKQDIFDYILREELHRSIEFNQEKLDLVQVRAFKKAYSRTLASVLKIASYMDTEANIYYSRRISKSIIRKAPKSTYSTLSICKPEVKVRHIFTPEEYINYSGELDPKDDNIFVAIEDVPTGKKDKDGNPIMKQVTKKINIKELEEEMFKNNFYIEDDIALKGLTIFDKEYKEFLERKKNTKLKMEEFLSTTKGKDDMEEKIKMKNDLEAEYQDLLKDYSELVNLLEDNIGEAEDKVVEEKPEKVKPVKKSKNVKVNKPQVEEVEEETATPMDEVLELTGLDTINKTNLTSLKVSDIKDLLDNLNITYTSDDVKADLVDKILIYVGLEESEKEEVKKEEQPKRVVKKKAERPTRRRVIVKKEEPVEEDNEEDEEVEGANTEDFFEEDEAGYEEDVNEDVEVNDEDEEVELLEPEADLDDFFEEDIDVDEEDDLELDELFEIEDEEDEDFDLDDFFEI